MATLEQKIIEIESRPSQLSENQIAQRRQNIENFIAISAFEGLIPSYTSLRLQELFAAEKLSSNEYVELCRQHSHELRV